MTDPHPAGAAVFVRPEPRRRRLLPVILITVLVVLAVVAALVVPVVVRGLTPSVSATERTVRLTHGTAQATLVLPGGWSWRTHLGDDSRGVVGSPDRVMTVELSLTTGTDTDAALERITPGPVGPTSEETLTRGVGTILHARVVDQETVVGAVADGPVVLAFSSTPSPAYDAELADLMATVRFEVVR